jgi:hydrogenase expression/formation protein HypC
LRRSVGGATDMCIGVPMRVISVTQAGALCEGRGERQQLDCMLLGDLPEGSWVLAFRGAAIRAMSAEEAAQTNAALDALAAVLAGEDVGHHFADLVDREPVLPPHLRGEPH